MSQLKLRQLLVMLCLILPIMLSSCRCRTAATRIILEIEDPSRTSFQFLSVEVNNDDCINVRATGTGPNRLVAWMHSSYEPQRWLRARVFPSLQWKEWY